MRGLADRLRPWLLPAGFLLGLSCFVFPLQNPDLWWHLSAGRWMAAHRALPRVDFLSHTLAGAKWVDFEWGAQLIYYGVHSNFGLLGLLALKLTVLGAMVWTSLRLLTLYGVPAEARGLGALLLCAAIVPLADIRPDNFSLLFFNLVFLRLEARRLGVAPFTRRTYAAAVLLFALWANLHLAFLYGLLLIGLYAAAEAVLALLPLIYGRGKAGPWEGTLGYLAFGAAAAAATFLNPYAADLYGVLREHNESMRYIKDIITEWQLPDVTMGLMRPFWLLLVLAFSGVLAHYLKTKRTPLPLVAVLLFFGLSSSFSQRHISYLCLIGLPVFFFTVRDLPGKVLSWGGGVLAILLCLHVAFGVSHIWMGPRDPLSVQVGEAEADFLLKQAPVLRGKKLYNVWGEGGYLGYALYPGYRVFYDGRYIFHHQLFETQAALHGAESWRAHMDRYGIEVAAMKRALSMRQELVPGKDGKGTVVLRPYYTGYMPAADWALVYWNAADLIFVRRSAVPAAWLARMEYRHLKPGDNSMLIKDREAGRLPLPVLRAELARHKAQAGGLTQETAPVAEWLEGLEKQRR